MKTCPKCKVTRPLEFFYVDRSKANGHVARCKLCARAPAKAWREANPERAKHIGRRERHGDFYPTPGPCALCGVVGPRVTDHDHAICGRRSHSCDLCRRDQLCNGCNWALGHFRDDPDLMRRAALYIERHNTRLKEALHAVCH